MSTEVHDPPGSKRSNSRTRPTTPLRPPSRSSFRGSARRAVNGSITCPLNDLEPAFAEFSDAMADLEANMMHFQLIHESLARFGESFASFLYGLNMNAFCVDFPEGPVAESFRRDRLSDEAQHNTATRSDSEAEATFMTTDTSFVDTPPAPTRPTVSSGAQETRQSRLPFARGSSTRGRIRKASDRGHSSGLVRPRVRGVR
ncbi:DASH complex component Dam1 [Drechmeria coniospora]|uniref:DASH complex subunit DAM1 n=1 Tax=Drechmeria coniospora TaxID=98403 RepID=A0A151GHR2_DRECN|nr:DASH complex component Dam1 [Drechmeria coniospora]KYK56663.1 DASH complex component Dam1 [Drechmeria coniospora]